MMEKTASPIVAIIGRPNAGKSTLFNRLTKSRQALVDDIPGVTRDRLYGQVECGDRRFTIVDTGGFNPQADELFAPQVHEQIAIALTEADAIILVIDGRQGLNPLDQEIIQDLYKSGNNKPVILAINKTDSPQREDSEFMALASHPLHFISAAHGYGINDMLDQLLNLIPNYGHSDKDSSDPMRVSFLGRPNVGKSSLVNALTGTQRAVVSDIAGATRDALDTPFIYNNSEYVLIDTAGVRRKAKISTTLEKSSIFRSLRAIERSHVVCVCLDISTPLTDQDLRIVGQVVEAGRGLLILLNKSDLLQKDKIHSQQLQQMQERLQTVAPFAPHLRISCLTGQGLNKIFPWVEKIFNQYNSRISTSRLNQAMESILRQHQPPIVKGIRPKFFYATQTSVRPPTIVFFVDQPQAVHTSYKRYLHNQLRPILTLENSPLRLIYKTRTRKNNKA
jgi:GTP-binding protein